jgi:hypothetical protein
LGTGLFGLAARLAAGAGREALVRLVVTAVGVALGVVLLLFATVAFPALRAHDARAGWLATGSHNIAPAQDERTTDKMLWRTGVDNYGDQEIVRVDVAAEGPRAPVPPGLDRLPGPGEYALSPALARLMATTPADTLADRFQGHAVETIGRAALAGPGQLMVIVGHDPAVLREYTGVDEVRSIEGAPVQRGYNEFLRIMLAVGIIGLVLPVIVFISTATQLAAARREQRLAALRLVGVTTGQAGVLAATEAAAAACAGTALGFAAFLVLRPYAARIPFDGTDFYPADLRLSVAWALVVALGVPLLAAVASLMSLRRLRISPLGVTRQAPRPRPTWRRLILLGAGLLAFVVGLSTVVANRGGNGPLAFMSIAFVLVVAGIVVAGPWLTLGVGRVLLRLGRSPSALLAARRLEENPAGGFRSISGLVLAVFVVSLICGVLPGAMGPGRKTTPVPAGAVLAYFGGRQATGISPASAGSLLGRLRGTAGVDHLVAFRRVPSTADEHDTAPVLVSCGDLAYTGLSTCGARTGIVRLDLHLLGTPEDPFLPLTHPVTGADLDALPLAALVVRTDGRDAVLEEARTAVYVGAADREVSVETTADENGRLNHRLIQLQRLATVALLLTLVIAGCSLAVSVAGGVVERKRPFALLRLAGAQPGDLRRVVLAETTGPLLTVAVISAGLGLALAATILNATGVTWRPPASSYWVALAAGLLLAWTLAAATALPLLSRLTSLETARFE